jgi:hypothetical protein
VWTWSAWVKIGYWSSGNAAILFGNGVNGGTNESSIKFVNNQLNVINYVSSTVQSRRVTTAVFRDPSAWYHIVVANNSSTSLNIYVNGVQITAFDTSVGPSAAAWALNTASTATNIGYLTSAQYFDGEMTEINFIDGQALTPSSFGSTNALTGVWQPARYTGTYGTNGFYLPFTDNSALTTSSNVGLGKDFSGNGNYWTTNNISITAGVTYDSMTDVPTLTSATAANFAVLNPLNQSSTVSLTNGNLDVSIPAAVALVISSMAVTSGKFYWEFTCGTASQNAYYVSVCDTNNWSASNKSQTDMYNSTFVWTYYGNNGNKITNATQTAYGASFTSGDVIGVALDMDNGTLVYYKNNTSQGTAFTGFTGKTIAPMIGNGSSTSSVAGSINFGQRPFTYTPPTGFVALNTYNLPTSTIVKGNTVMDATLYTGNGSTQSIVNAAAFKPDLVWVKGRSNATNHKLTDSVRGTTKALSSNLTDAEITDANGLTAFNSNGFTLGLDSSYNATSNTMVAWQWQAGQGSTSSNTNGSITSTVSVNASAGFSVVTFTGQTSGVGTVGHGLGVAPQLIIIKARANAYGWPIYHISLGNTNYVVLNATSTSTADANEWNNTSPTSSVFTLGTNFISYGTGVAYCWTPIAGFSAFGSYTGNASTDGPFVYCGFRPRWILFKASTAVSGGNWVIVDTVANTYNVCINWLFPNLNAAESNYITIVDVLSNGFKIRANWDTVNASGATMVYAAFAENPFKNSLAR